MLYVPIYIALVFLQIITIRTLETWLLAALVFQMSVKRTIILVRFSTINAIVLSLPVKFRRGTPRVSHAVRNRTTDVVVPSVVADH